MVGFEEEWEVDNIINAKTIFKYFIDCEWSKSLITPTYFVFSFSQHPKPVCRSGVRVVVRIRGVSDDEKSQ